MYNDYEYQQMLALQEMQNQQYQQQMAQMNQMYSSPVRAHKPTKKELKEYLVNYLGACDVVAVDEFDTLRTRHICNGGKNILLLERSYLGIPTDYGVIQAEFFFFQNCRKLIYNKSSIEL